MPSRIIAFIETRETHVQVTPEHAEELATCADSSELAEQLDQCRLAAGGNLAPHTIADLHVECDPPPDPFVTPLEGDGELRRLWAARHAVSDARRQLAAARHQEGDIRTVEQAIATLDEVEEQLRVAALAEEGLGPDFQPLQRAPRELAATR